MASAIGNAYQQNAPGASPQPQVLAVDPSSELFMSLPLVDNTGAPLYSAIVLASSCDKGYMSTGNPSVDDEVYSAYASRLGCDNTATDIAAVTGRVGAIGTFFNNGGGLLALSGGTLRDSYYKLLPIPVSAGGSPAPTRSPPSAGRWVSIRAAAMSTTRTPPKMTARTSIAATR